MAKQIQKAAPPQVRPRPKIIIIIADVVIGTLLILVDKAGSGLFLFKQHGENKGHRQQ